MSTPKVKPAKPSEPVRIPKGEPPPAPLPRTLPRLPGAVPRFLEVRWLCRRGLEGQEVPWLVLCEPGGAAPATAEVRVLADGSAAEVGRVTESVQRGAARGQWKVPVLDASDPGPAGYLLEAEVGGRRARSCVLPVHGRLAVRVVDVEGQPVACELVLRWPDGREQRVRTDAHGLLPVCEGPAGEVVLEKLAPRIPQPEREGEPEPAPSDLEPAEADLEPGGRLELRTHRAWRLTWRGWEVVDLAFEPQRAAAGREVELVARCVGKPPAALRLELWPWRPEDEQPAADDTPLAALEATVRKGEARAKWTVQPPPIEAGHEPPPPVSGVDDDGEHEDGGWSSIPLVFDERPLPCEYGPRAVWFRLRCEEREADSRVFAHGRLEVWAWLRVRLVDECTDEPIADLALDLIEPDGSTRPVQTDGAGRLALEELVRPGLYTLVPRPDPERGTYAPIRVATVDRDSQEVAVALLRAAPPPELEPELDALCREALEAAGSRG